MVFLRVLVDEVDEIYGGMNVYFEYRLEVLWGIYLQFDMQLQGKILLFEFLSLMEIVKFNGNRDKMLIEN